MRNGLMNQKEAGFTLIELIMVIVILGILAVTALPKFNDLRSDASTAAASGVAGALNGAFSNNFSTFLANSTKAIRINATAQACSDTAMLGTAGVLQGGLPSGYTMSSDTVNCSASGATLACTVSGSNASTASVTLICTG